MDKTIEQRASEYSKGRWDELTAKEAYIAGAKDQKAIDDAEKQYKQGYHDAIEKFCELLRSNWRKYVYRDRDGGILFGHWESDFRKAMEEELCQR